VAWNHGVSLFCVVITEYLTLVKVQRKRFIWLMILMDGSLSSMLSHLAMSQFEGEVKRELSACRRVMSVSKEARDQGGAELFYDYLLL
jgi:hypothetical protein